MSGCKAHKFSSQANGLVSVTEYRKNESFLPISGGAMLLCDLSVNSKQASIISPSVVGNQMRIINYNY